MSSESFTLPSYAKLNWTLRVLGRRDDGYHELETIFQTVTLHDALEFSTRTDGSIILNCDAPDIPVDDGNLIVRAAQALRHRYRIKKGAAIRLEKRIPAAGGLGGGSSNAAVALLGLAQLWQLEIEKPQLEEIGARLGADVPFFLTGGTALGTGLGTDIAALADAPRAFLLIATPDVKVSTAEAYKALNAPALTKVGGDIILSSSRPHAQFSDSFPAHLRNDFEPVIFGLYPETMRARDALLDVGARRALLAGSGASVFGLFDNEQAREDAARVLRAETGWRIFECTSLSRAQYLKSLGACAAPLLRAA